MNKSYYLETSALRALGNRIDHLDKDRDYFTSILCLIELISAAKDSERAYNVAKIITKSIDTNRIRIDWEFPEGKVGKSFSNLQYKEVRVCDVQKVTELLKLSSSLANFLEAATQAQIQFGLNFISHYDNSFGVSFTKATIDGNKDIKKALSQGNSSSVFLKEELSLPIKDFCNLLNTKYFNFNLALTVHALSASLGTWVEEAPSDECISKIYESYNNGIHMFTVALTFYGTQMCGMQNHPGRNDFLDLSHFMYLDVDDVIVSNDTDIVTLANTFAIGTALRPSEL